MGTRIAIESQLVSKLSDLTFVSVNELSFLELPVGGVLFLGLGVVESGAVALADGVLQFGIEFVEPFVEVDCGGG